MNLSKRDDRPSTIKAMYEECEVRCSIVTHDVHFMYEAYIYYLLQIFSSRDYSLEKVLQNVPRKELQKRSPPMGDTEIFASK